jgi:hypothetical protein
MAKKTASHAKKKTAGKKKGASKGKKAAVAKQAAAPIDAMTANQQQTVFRAVQAALSKSGVANQLTAIHFDTDFLGLVCTAPKVRRMVCRLVNGVPVCRPECVEP